MALNSKLTDPQTIFFRHQSKYPLFVGGFGSGKSEGLFVKLLAEKLKRPKVDIGYFAPTYTLIRDIAHIRIQSMLDEIKIPYKLNKADNVLTIKNKGRILFRTLDNPDRIVGFEIFSAFCDELDTMTLDNAKNAWEKLIARIRQKDPMHPKDINKIYTATTPEGYRFCYDRWVKQATPANAHLYGLVRAPTASNPYLPDDYIDSLMASYPSNLIEAYLNGEFVNLNSQQVYPNFNREIHHTDRTHLDHEELHIGMDFNVFNMNAVTHLIDRDEKQAFAVDETTNLKDTPEMIEVLKEKYPHNKLFIYPDASGKSRKSVDASKSDITLLQKAGFTVRKKNKNPLIKNRVMSMNAMFKTGDNKNHYWVNTDKCPSYTSALEQQAYDKNGQPEKDPNNPIDDLCDAGGYCIYYNFPIDKPKSSIIQHNLYH